MSLFKEEQKNTNWTLESSFVDQLSQLSISNSQFFDDYLVYNYAAINNSWWQSLLILPEVKPQKEYQSGITLAVCDDLTSKGRPIFWGFR